MTGKWELTRWWRAVGPDGKVWAESSDEQEVRQMTRSGDRVQRLLERRQQRWVSPEEAVVSPDLPGLSFPNAEPCPSCKHPRERHYGRWCRVPTGAIDREGRALICCCEAVDRDDVEVIQPA